MRFTIEQSDQTHEVEIVLKCGQIDKPLERLIEQIRLYGFSISGQKEGESFVINLEDVFYFESIDNRTYVYCKEEVYECKQKLYEIEERLTAMNFLRISRSALLNIYKIVSLRTLLNGRVEVRLENEEKLIVNRHYVEALKEKIYGEER